MQATGKNSSVELSGSNGTLEITSSGLDPSNQEGLFLYATSSGTITLNLGKIQTDARLQLSTAGENSVVSATAKEIIIGDGKYDQSKKGSNDGRADIWLGGHASDDNKGKITLGSGTSTITVNRDGKIRAVGSSGGTSIEAETLQVNGGVLSFAHIDGQNYTTTIKAHDTNIQSGWMDVKPGSSVVLDLASKGTSPNEVKGTMDFSGTAENKSYLVVGGQLKIATGKVTLDSNTVLAGHTESEENNSAVIVSGSSASLNLESSTLSSYLSATTTDNKGLTYIDENRQFKDEDPSKAAKKGSIILSASGSLNFTDSTNIDLSKFAFSGDSSDPANPADGTIVVSGTTGTISGENLTVSAALKSGGSSVTVSNLNISATNLTLGSSSYSGESSLGFGAATAKNVTFASKNSSGFTLANKLTLTSTREVTSGSTTVIEADSGSIVGDVIVTGNTASPLTINGGNYTGSNNITLQGGNLVVGTNKQEASSSLTFTGDLILNGGQTNTITVEGASSNNTTALLDLTDADVAFTSGDAAALTTITVSGNATLRISGDDATDLLGKSSENNKGATFFVSGGHLEVQGDLGSSDKAISVDNIDTTQSTSGGHLSLTHADSKLSADTLYLADSAAGEVLSFAGNINVDTLNLSSTDAANTTFDFDSGTMTVLEGIQVAKNTKVLELGIDFY